MLVDPIPGAWGSSTSAPTELEAVLTAHQTLYRPVVCLVMMIWCVPYFARLRRTFQHEVVLFQITEFAEEGSS